MTKKRIHRASEPEATATPSSGPGSASGTSEVGEGNLDFSGEPPSFPIVGVGASAGGLEAFHQLLGSLPVDTGMAFVLVQHLAASHPSALAEILSRATRMPVTEVRYEAGIEPNSVYVIPPDRDMILTGGTLQLLPRDAGVQHRPIDRFFLSLAEAQNHKALGVVLSGTGSDGTSGLEAIKSEGGITFAQDATAQHQGMPRSAIESGCVDFILNPGEIADEIARIGRHPHASAEPGYPEPAGQKDLVEIVDILRRGTGVDFSSYKTSTLYRRVMRRMILSKNEGLSQYLHFLRETPAEVEALFQDVLIRVTSFFRDPDCFEALKSQVFSALIGDRSRQEPVRIWTLGCSTGEEVYSLAMAFTESAQASGTELPLQFFATDLNDRNIEKARAGVYPKEIAHDVSQERLERFFARVDGRYRIIKSIRDVCVFSKHNVLADPPFSRIDLISCRNLLIYLEPVLQKRILPLLHYALKPTGFLWLGGSETIGSYRNLFEAGDVKHKIYAKKPRSGPAPAVFSLQRAGSGRTDFGPDPFPGVGKGEDLDKEADRVLAAKFAPPGVVISADYEILKYRGDTRPYLAHSPGKASLNLLKMLREGLLVGLRAALVRASKEEVPVREEGLQIKSDDGHREVAVEVIPLKRSGATGGGFLVLFEEAAPSGPASSGMEEHARGSESRPDPRKAGGTVVEAADLVVTRLTQELATTREYLQSIIEQQEAANEELQSANEEAQSSNEELQSTNEELETSKEEIQSSNEELATVNDELNNRNAELDRLNNDLINLLSSVEMPIVILGPNFCIRRFTPSAAQLFNLIPADLGRPIGAIKLGLPVPDMERLLIEVRDTVTSKQREVRDEHGRWYSLRVRPYLTLENRVDGVVVMLIDVDTLKRAQEYTESIVSTVRESLLVLGADLRVRTASRSFYKTFDVTPEATEGQPFFELSGGRWDDPELRRLLEEIVSRDSNFTDFEVHQDFEDGHKKVLLLNARRLIQESDRSPSILLAIQDVTELKQVQQADRRKNEFLAMLAHELRNPLAAISYAEQTLHAPGMEEMQAWSKEVIGRQVKYLSRLLDDLLDVSRITHGKIILKFERVSLRTVIGRSIEMTQPLVEERKHHITVAVEPATMTLEADPTRLEQIFSNLITNAAKYTDDGGRISITARPEGGECVVTVTDQGPGLAAEMLPQVFDLFTQVGDSLHRSKGGLGIGLTLVRKLAELHGGSVQARSQGIGHGSEFIVRIPLPMSPAPETPAPAVQSVNVPSRKSRILIVEDNVDTALGMAQHLEMLGHEVGTVHDGFSALHAAREQRFDFILLDIGLPGLSGYEVASELRKDGCCKESVIIAVSGYGQEEDRRRSRAAGFDHHLVKPIDHNSLLKLLSHSH